MDATSHATDPLETSLCRDCLTRIPSAPTCSNCGSRRLLSHPELYQLTIAHIDCDAFYAAVEKRDNSALKNKPLIIGHGKRGVVATACYIARLSGVGSAMPVFKARKLCPDAIFIPPNMKKYRDVSRQIRSMMQALTPLVEPLSLDEAFLDLSGTERMQGVSAAETMARLAKNIEDEIGISASVGLAPNKFLAKLASDINKPRGFSVIGKGDMIETLAAMEIKRIWGVGKSMQRQLTQAGLTHIAQLQQMQEAPLIKRYGELGQRLYKLSRGIDTRTVNPSRPTKSISTERTLEKNLKTYESLEALLWPMCERVSHELKQKNFAAMTITLKMKNSQHKSVTRSRTLDNPTQMAELLFEVGSSLLKTVCGTSYYRLIGIGASQLTVPDQADPPDLIEPGRTKRISAERAMDNLRSKYGEKSITKGRSFNSAKNAE